MTKEGISKYIYDKNIPLRFIWENGITYNMVLSNNNSSTNGFKNSIIRTRYPNWFYDYKTYEINSIQYLDGNVKKLFKFERETFEQCLGEFLIWWEINKHRCRHIKYYGNKRDNKRRGS